MIGLQLSNAGPNTCPKRERGILHRRFGCVDPVQSVIYRERAIGTDSFKPGTGSDSSWRLSAFEIALQAHERTVKPTVVILAKAKFLRMVLGEIASDAGWHIAAETEDPVDFERLLRTCEPALAIVASNHPLYETAAQMRPIQQVQPGLHVIVIGPIASEEKPESLPRNITDFVAQPFSRERLLQSLAKAGH